MRTLFRKMINMHNFLFNKKEKSRVCVTALFCIVTAAILLAVTSKCSFLYPLNDWQDANIYLTMGKSMLDGRILYRDCFDHKGPLLYFLHAIAAFVTSRSFFGVYILEIAAFSTFLFGAWKLISLYCPEGNVITLPVLGAAILSSPAFCHGDSAEELCLPLLMWSLYNSVCYLKKEYPNTSMPARTVFLNGVLAGCVLWIKYTLLGFHFAWMAMMFFSCLFRKAWKEAFLDCLIFLAGMVMTALPWIAYFGYHHSLGYLWECYVYDNIFLYAKQEPIQWWHVIKSMIKNLLDCGLTNWKFSLWVILGEGAFLFSNRNTWIEKCNLLALSAFTAFGVCWGVVQWQPYYGLVFGLFAVFGMIPLCWLAEKILENTTVKRGKQGAIFAFVLVMSLLWCLKTGNYTDQIGRNKNTLVQYQFADIICETEEATLLNYGFMDGGFYTAAGITPQNRFYCTTNMPLPDRYEEQRGMVLAGAVDYVVTRDYPLEGDELLHYRLIAREEQEYEHILYTYFLYQRN